MRNRNAYGWYLGDGVNFHPDKDMMATPNAFRGLVLKGWAPQTPFIDHHTMVTAFGSCFAAEISEYLHKRKYRVNRLRITKDQRFMYMARYGAGLNNAFSMEQQFRFAFTDWAPPEGLWVDRKGNTVDALKWKDDLCKLFHNTEVFILTLGLAEVWKDAKSGEAMWGTVLQKDYEEGRHLFEVTTVEDNYKKLREIVRLIQDNRPEAKIIFTVSPVPLLATFRPVSCITANEVSKSIVRVAVDRIMRDKIPNVYYFPGYEMVRVLSQDPYQQDARHVNDSFIAPLMEDFLRFYAKAPERPLSRLVFLGAPNPEDRLRWGQALSDELSTHVYRNDHFDFKDFCEVIDKTPHDGRPQVWTGKLVHFHALRLCGLYPDSRIVLVNDPTEHTPHNQFWERAIDWRLNFRLKAGDDYALLSLRSMRSTVNRSDKGQTMMLNPNQVDKGREFVRTIL